MPTRSAIIDEMVEERHAADLRWLGQLIQSEITNGAVTDREIVIALSMHAPQMHREAWFVATLKAARAALDERNRKLC
jgi:hypothetical protein